MLCKIYSPKWQWKLIITKTTIESFKILWESLTGLVSKVNLSRRIKTMLQKRKIFGKS